ncbi:VanZ family protein [Deinococcus cellulosilyticus]|uniref:Antibiotic resistance protein VanZ n=1 Tax=Deinococcus cellulosilyticus (strain DSM 18568 / NBRC 106333 / KACC 11606 / 5516J-15) TaxID=1223518 RepID=A0A511NC24_DEIC1|nr:VanZ family protein [Deinococcus cellulosilyticus]GEM49921.1 antibiotic resistance protein VanZ [Deinococcus cellulosilyticus NBRC 106333 = KACC 11606]
MKVGWWLLSLLYMGVIYWFSAQSGGAVGIPAPWDKVAHTLEYLGLGFLLGKATRSWKAAWVLTAWYGALDEVHQAFVPMRMAGIDDWWFDLLGGLLGSRLGAGRKPRQEEATPEAQYQFNQNFE